MRLAWLGSGAGSYSFALPLSAVSLHRSTMSSTISEHQSSYLPHTASSTAVDTVVSESGTLPDQAPFLPYPDASCIDAATPAYVSVRLPTLGLLCSGSQLLRKGLRRITGCVLPLMSLGKKLTMMTRPSYSKVPSTTTFY